MDDSNKGTHREGLRVIEGGRSGKHPSGLTNKQEQFVQGLAQGLTNADAYRSAFDSSGMKPSTIYSKASELASRENIRARLSAILTERKVREHHVSEQARERLSDRIWRGIWRVAEDDATPPAARVAALQLAAKAAGMLVEKVETRSLNTPEDLEKELRERLKKFATDK